MNNIKQELEKIEIPKELNNRVIIGIKQAQMEKKKSLHKWMRPRKKNILTGMATATALIGITITSGFVNPTMNKVLANTPLIGGIFQKFNDQTGVELSNQNAVTKLNQSITKNGVTVKLTSAYFDGNVVSITGFVDEGVEKGKNEKGEVSFDVNFEHNKGDNDPWLNGKSTLIKKVGNGYDFQWKMEYPYKLFKENYSLPITIHNINGIKGEWNFDIPIKQEKNKTFAINKEQVYPEDEVKLRIKEILNAKASSSLIFETVEKYKDDEIIMLKAIDNNGNIYRFGNETSLEGSAQEDGYHSTVRTKMSKLKSNIKSLTFYPQINVADPKVSQLLDKTQFTFKSKRLSLGLQVNNIIQKGNTLVIDYQFTGLSKELSKHQLDLYENNLQYELLLVDKEFIDKIDPENPVPPKDYSIRLNKVKTIDKKTAHFQSTFDLNGQEKIKNFKLDNTILQFDFSNFVPAKELKPFTVELPMGNG